MESKVKDGNYYVVQSFMVKDLQLKGLEKDLYAIIYGFSQADDQTFSGSLQYLADWTQASKQGVVKALKSLQEKELIGKKENYKNGVKFVEYYTTEFNRGIQLSCMGGIQPSLSNKDNSNINYKDIIEYLNVKAGTNYRATTGKTQSLINARFKEGFTKEDFFMVIDKKVAEWKGTQMEQYLRPETLFGTKFEGYLNTRGVKPNARQTNAGDCYDNL